MVIAVISDTHLPRGTRGLPPACEERLAAADLILHAGDIATLEVLADLGAYGPPVLAVHGNVDGPEVRAMVPPTREIDAAGARIGMIHDAGPAPGRLERLRGLFPACDAVIFGHSHIPLHERTPDGFQIFNPGSPTDRRRQPRHTMGVARAEDGALAFELVPLP
jgi:putative phosphoesterase